MRDVGGAAVFPVETLPLSPTLSPPAILPSPRPSPRPRGEGDVPAPVSAPGWLCDSGAIAAVSGY